MISAPIPAIRRVVVGPATKCVKSRTLYPSSRCPGLSPIAQLAVCCRARMAGERFNASQTDRVPANLKAAQEIKCGDLTAFKFQRKERTGIVGLLIANSDLLHIRKERRIDNASDLRMVNQMFGNPLCVLALAIHS